MTRPTQRDQVAGGLMAETIIGPVMEIGDVQNPGCITDDTSRQLIRVGGLEFLYPSFTARPPLW
jgi:hypothetical protein